MHLALDGAGSLTSQLLRALRDAVRSGALVAGTRLPSSRELARDLGLSRNVVLAAFGQLSAEGYLTARAGAGTFVANDLTGAHGARQMRRRTKAAQRVSTFASRLAEGAPPLPVSNDDGGRANRAAFDFRYGQVEFEGVARRAWSRLLARHARGVGATELAPVAGHRPLRHAIAEHLRYARGVRADVGAVFVTHGVQDAFDRCARLLLEPGRGVVLEDPHYPAARAIAIAHGAEVEAVPVDAAGLDTVRLPSVDGALAYVTPSHQFPLGSVLSLPRRHALLRWAARHDAVVFEDDYDSQFRYDARPIESLASLDRDRVVYAGSFSKTIAPGLRLGYVVVPDGLVEPFRRLAALTTSGTTRVLQHALGAFLDEGHFARHLRRVGREYALRRAALLAAATRHLGDAAEVVGADAGVHVVLRCRGHRVRDARSVVGRLAAAGVGVDTIGSLYLGADAARPLELLLGYGRLGPEQIERGVRRLAEVLTSRAR